MSAATATQAAAAVEIVKAIADAIRDIGRPVPAGEIYARVMGVIDLRSFNFIIGVLTRAQLVTEDRSHLLTWIGPMPIGAETDIEWRRR